MAHGTAILPITASIRATGSFSVPDTKLLEYPLYDSIILDSGSTMDIGNTRSRFRNLRQPRPDKDNFIYAGDTLVLIDAYGTLSVVVQTQGFPNSRIISFYNAAYVLVFYTLVISFKRLNKNEIY